MPQLEVLAPGMLTLIQDIGRFGFAHLGLSQGGAADLHAYCWSNYLHGNTMDCPALEIIAGQTAVQAIDDICLAITGADLGATIDHQPIKNWRTFVLFRGQTLRFHTPVDGMRAYLSTPGGFMAPATFGSAATVVRDRLGGLGDSIGKGQPVMIHDRLQARESRMPDTLNHKVPDRYIPDYSNTLQLRVIESYQSEQFSEKSKQTFYSETFTLSQQSNRMGYRLEGAIIEPPSGGIISEGIALGAIQVPESGQPIILLNDRQTLGGYCKLGCVAQIDLMKLAQVLPGAKIQFVQSRLDPLLAELKAFMRFFSL